jgi:hypothetical protein
MTAKLPCPKCVRIFSGKSFEGCSVRYACGAICSSAVVEPFQSTELRQADDGLSGGFAVAGGKGCDRVVRLATAREQHGQRESAAGGLACGPQELA